MAMEQRQYAIMEWTTDGNRLSVHHLKYITDPIKSWNDYEPGDRGKAKYPGAGEEPWDFVIHAVGGRSYEINRYMYQYNFNNKIFF